MHWKCRLFGHKLEPLRGGGSVNVGVCKREGTIHCIDKTRPAQWTSPRTESKLQKGEGSMIRDQIDQRDRAERNAGRYREVLEHMLRVMEVMYEDDWAGADEGATARDAQAAMNEARAVLVYEGGIEV